MQPPGPGRNGNEVYVGGPVGGFGKRLFVHPSAAGRHRATIAFLWYYIGVDKSVGSDNDHGRRVGL